MGNEAEKPSIITSSLDFLVNWGRTNSLWPFPYGTACCAIEFMSTEVGRYDLSRIGSEYVRFTPRQSDVLLVAGTITYKQAPILKRIYEQMAEPRWVIAMGACACSGGFYDCYCTVPGIDHIIPIDRGGHPSDISNLQLAHWKCNRAKSNKLIVPKKTSPSEPGAQVDSNRNFPLSMDWSAYRAKG